MDTLIDWFSILLIFAGCIFCLVGAFGLLRMPSFITRVHAASLIDSLGAILIITGLTFQAGFTIVTIKLVLILTFLLLTGPTAIHAVVNAALHEDRSYITGKDISSNT